MPYHDFSETCLGTANLGGSHARGGSRAVEPLPGRLGSIWEGPRKSLGAPRKLLGKVTNVTRGTKVTKCIIDYRIDHLASKS